MGTKSYAEQMTKILDPKGKLFAGRIIARENNNDSNKDLSKVSRMVSSILIMDDTVEVWPHNNPNVIVVERYLLSSIFSKVISLCMFCLFCF